MTDSQEDKKLVPDNVTVAQISDCLDQLGYRHQCLSPRIEPLDPSMRVVGRAFTVDVELVDEPPPERYVGLLQALDALGAGDIYAIASKGEQRAALWGELLATSARARGAVGALTDGAIRDAAQLLRMGFPTFAFGTCPADIHGRYEVTQHGRPITLGGVEIHAGDLIVGDIDGVVVVPQAVESEAIERAAEKAGAESRVRDMLAEGALPSKAFAEHDVL